jgi:hypothetical protein
LEIGGDEGKEILIKLPVPTKVQHRFSLIL